MPGHLGAVDSDRHPAQGASSATAGQLLEAGGSDTQTFVTIAGDITGPITSATVTDLTIASEVQGSVIYFDGTNWVQLAPGTSGFQLTTQGPAANPIWAAAGAGAGNSLDAAYDQGGAGAGRIVAVDTGAVVFDVSTSNHRGLEINLNGPTGRTLQAISILSGAITYTGAGVPNGILIDFSPAGVLNSANGSFGIDLTGEPNIGAGNSTGLIVRAGWDIGINLASGSFVSGGSAGLSGRVLTSGGTGATPTWIEPVNQLARFNANDATFPASSPAAATSRNEHPLLGFDDTTPENVVLHDSISLDYSAGSITVDVTWVASTATTGDVVWGVEFEAGSPDIDADSFAAQQTGTDTTNATSGIDTVTSISLSQAQADSIAAGIPYRLRVQRVATSGSDTMSGDAQIRRVLVRQ